MRGEGGCVQSPVPAPRCTGPMHRGWGGRGLDARVSSARLRARLRTTPCHGRAMLILMPDAQIEDDAEIERGVLGEGVEIALHRELVADRIPAEQWSGADALIVYYGVPIDRAVIDRLARCRIVVRAGAGYDQIDLAAFGARGIPVCNVPDYRTTDGDGHGV